MSGSDVSYAASGGTRSGGRPCGRRHARLRAGLARAGPRRRDARRASRPDRGGGGGRRGRDARTGGPLRGSPRLRHRGPSRRARRRLEPHEPRARRPGGRGPRRLSAREVARHGGAGRRRRPGRRHRLRRPSQLADLRARLGRAVRRRRASGDPAASPAAHAGARVRRAPSRARPPASWSPRATTRPTTTGTRSTSAVRRRARRSSRRPTPRSPRTSSGSRMPATSRRCRARCGFELAGEAVVDAYIAATAAVAPAPEGAEGMRWVYTAMHGVGWETLSRVLEVAGYPSPQPVSEQLDPDGSFPTVAFPNPEEPGAMDLAFETARASGRRGRDRQRPGCRSPRGRGARLIRRRRLATAERQPDRSPARLAGRAARGRTPARSTAPRSRARWSRRRASSRSPSTTDSASTRRSPDSSGSLARPGSCSGSKRRWGTS